MSAKAYYVKKWSYDIEEFVAVKWTEKTVTIINRWALGAAGSREDRAAIASDWGRYFKTEAEAKAHLVNRATATIKNARDMILEAEAAIKKFTP